MITRPIPQRYWHSYGDDPLPTPEEAPGRAVIGVPVVAPTHGMRHVRARTLLNEVHLPHWHDATLRAIVTRLHHEGCGGRPKLVELVTGIGGASRPVRRILLLG